jgi:hypothetical protein
MVDMSTTDTVIAVGYWVGLAAGLGLIGTLLGIVLGKIRV